MSRRSPELLLLLLLFQIFITWRFRTRPSYKRDLCIRQYTVPNWFFETILFSKVAFTEVATDFGSFAALENISNLWFVCPVLTIARMFFPWLLVVFNGIRGSNVFTHIESNYEHNPTTLSNCRCSNYSPLLPSLRSCEQKDNDIKPLR